MENEYRPFFSRKQLNVLMWFSLIAILVLSSLGPGDVEYEEIQHNETKTVYWMELDDQLHTLTLLLPTPPALHKSQQQLQQLQAQVLLSRLKLHGDTTYTYNVYPRQDRIELSLNWADGSIIPDIPKLLTVLQQPIESGRWEAVLKNLQARDYLEKKAIEEPAIERFFTQFQPPVKDVLSALAPAYSNLFSGIKYVISGDNAEAIAEQIAITAATTPKQDSNAVSVISAADLQSTSSHPELFVFLTGEAIPPRGDNQFSTQRLIAQVLQSLLENHQQTYSFDYRLLWGSLNTTGYRAVILKANQPPAAILRQLQQLISEELVESAQNRLVSQWQDKMRDLANQIQAMNLIAYYDLPVTTLEQYTETIQELDKEQMVTLAKKALNSDQAINIMLNPSYTQ